jgi:multidrug efflux pump subunit AcrA (membrane-fusion protein)
MARAFLLLSVFITASLLVGCDNKPPATAAPPAPSVTVARPVQKLITEWDEYTGRFAAVETVEVRARVSGFIDSIHFNEGQMVPG